MSNKITKNGELIGHIVKRNTQYLLKDNTDLKRITVSQTSLYPHQSTNGHTHDQEEVYVFTHGHGSMNVGEETLTIAFNDVVIIPSGTFHKVMAGYHGLTFISVFERYEREQRITT